MARLCSTMLDTAKLNKMIAVMVGSIHADADNAYRAIVKMVSDNNVPPSYLHLHVYGDEDDYVASVLSAKDREIEDHLGDLEAALDEIENLRAENRKIAALQAEVDRLNDENERLKAQIADTQSGPHDFQELEAYRKEDGEPLAAVKREMRRIIPIRYGWKTVFWHLLSANGLKRAKGSVYAWLSGRSRMPPDVLDIIRSEADRLAAAGVERFENEWRAMQRGYLYGYNY
ncbi:hypothetical protein WV31_20835 [Magnetospirillum sp. ME-1]|nr:hypothetical protein WV31_20835 [Magnetospirillum sp. ME-1]